MSRRKSQGDSLDLLLDTICNTFGGVLFIAILVVILLQFTSESSSPAEARPNVPPDVLQRLRTRYEAAAAQLAQLRKTLSSQEQVIAEYAPDAVRKQVDERAVLTAERDRLQAELDEMTSDNLETAEQTAEVLASNAALRQSLEESRQRHAELEEELRELRESRRQDAALPVVRAASGKSEIGVVVRYGRMYVWHKYGPYGIRQGLNLDEFVVVGEEDGALVTHPNPAAGVVLDGSDAMRRAILARLSQFSPSEHYITAVVRPDSFGQFAFLRDTLVARGFHYRLMPVGEGTGVYDRGGSGGRVQ